MVIYRLSALARVKIRGMLQVLGHSSCIISSYLKHVASERKIFGVRNQSTKDNVGTLPLFVYTTPDQPPRPLDFSTTDDLTARETVVTEIEQEAVRGAILFEANSVVVVKRDHIRGYPNRGPFFVGIVIADVTDKEENSFCDIELFVSSFEDCLLFTLNESVRIHRDVIVSKVGEEHFMKKGAIL